VAGSAKNTWNKAKVFGFQPMFQTVIYEYQFANEANEYNAVIILSGDKNKTSDNGE